MIDHIGQILLRLDLGKAHILADPVQNNDLVVDGITDGGEHRRHKRKIHLKPEDGENRKNEKCVI
ncbi:hypothetical protein D3C72_2530980 [compost metagenome]